MRLFFAVELSPEARAALGRLRPAAGTSGADAYRWVDPSLHHVTLAFLGEHPESALPSLQAAGERAASGSRSGRLALGEAGSFGSARAPRVLWVGLDGDLDRLAALHGRLTEALRQAGFPVEERPFRPHITLARRRESARPGPTPWPPARVPASPFPLADLTLVQSQLGSGGPRYTPLARFPLGEH